MPTMPNLCVITENTIEKAVHCIAPSLEDKSTEEGNFFHFVFKWMVTGLHQDVNSPGPRSAQEII